jgi:riboflavin biosynthesis pyrimidine reductase
MIASVDGRATIDGRAGKLGHPEDRALLRELRAGADAVLVGERTLAIERYASLLDDDHREQRRAAGLPESPLLATVSRRLTLSPADIPLFDEEGARIAVYSEREGELAPCGADVVVHGLGEGRVDFGRLLAHLHEHYGVQAVACEGGPTLLREMVAQRCVDELWLTVSPVLVAGDGPTTLSGIQLAEPHGMRLADALRADDHLFLRYST